MDDAHLGVRLARACATHATRPATRLAVGDDWVVQTYAEHGERVRALAARFVAAGIGVGDRVCLLARNHPDWSAADAALLSIRAVPVPVYPTSTPGQIRHILADAGCVWAVVEGQELAGRLAEVAGELPELRGVWSLVAADGARTLDDVLAEPVGDEAKAEVGARLAEASADDVASIIYTSGTTGDPRGVVLTHRGFTFELDALDAFFAITPEDSSLCFLPLSHALERAWTYKVLTGGCLNTYVPDARTVAEMLVRAEPTMFVSVPRLYEKVYQTVLQRVSGSPVKRGIYDWAMRVGAACQREYVAGRRPSAVLVAQLRVADRLVFRAVRDAMGGPKTVMACGGAPLRREVEEFFSAAGMLLCQGYGLTEASPLVSFNAPAGFRFGSCGRVVVGGELAVGAEGEVLYRGPNVMQGYWNLPEATASAIDSDGWLHTGDVGHVDDDGFLHITDRIKDLIVTSTGKNVAPASIEGEILADPLFEHAVVLGDNRPYLTLLVRPSLPALEDLAASLHVNVPDARELIHSPEVLGAIRERVGALTARLPSHEQIRDLRLMLEEFTMDNGLLTPTLKVRRRQVEERFAHLIEDMYARVHDRRGRSGSD